MHPSIHIKTKFPITKIDIQSGMVVEFMYKSKGYYPRKPRNILRHVLVIDPYWARSDGGGEGGLKRGFYLWGIDLEKIMPAELELHIKNFIVVPAGPKSRQIKTSNNIPLIMVPGSDGRTRYTSISRITTFMDNYRSFNWDKITGTRVIQYWFKSTEIYDIRGYEDSLRANGYVDAGDSGAPVVIAVDSGREMSSRTNIAKTESGAELEGEQREAKEEPEEPAGEGTGGAGSNL